MKKPELLAPAGDIDKLKFAFLYGADAVYIGGKNFSLRARASNFGITQIKEATNFAHKLGKKIYVTTNIVPHNNDFDGFVDYIHELEKIGVDAVICASFAMADIVLKETNIPVHISTQQSITNQLGALFWQNKGAERVVLARELSLLELQTLRENTDIELEVFIHGGMCVSYSGRCTLSNNMTDRDANRGGCAHSCRWNYDLFYNEEKINKEIPFSMSSKDLQAVKHIKDLMTIGIDSLKIEGRMKSIHYIATVVSTYRHLIDDIYEGKEIDFNIYEKQIAKAENRLTSDGFFNGMPTKHQQLYNCRSENPTQEFVAVVLEYNPIKKIALIEQRNKFSVNDKLQHFHPGRNYQEFIVKKIIDEKGMIREGAPHPKEKLYITVPFEVKPFDILRKIK